jgi:hypothetical protein
MNASQAMFLFNNNIPHPVENGLDQPGFSFGSMMSVGTTTTNQPPGGQQRLEKGGHSIGSMMSYTMTDNNNNNNNNTYNKSIPGYQQQQHKRDDSFGGAAAAAAVGAPELSNIGTSFGSLSLNPMTEREMMMMLRETTQQQQQEMEQEVTAAAACAALPTYLKVQKSSRGNLLECSDSDEETEPEMVAQKSANWERLQAAIAAQDNLQRQQKAPPPQGGMVIMPLPPSFYSNGNNNEPTMVGIPAMTEGFVRNFSNMSAISIGEDFELPPYALPQQMQQQQQLQQSLHYAGGGIGYYNNSSNNNHSGYSHQMPEMPLPLANAKTSSSDDDWDNDLHHRYDQPGGHGR